MVLAFVTGAWLSSAPAQTTSEPADAQASEHLEQLRTCREGVVDAQARPEDRRRWVELLFSYSTPQADTLVVELLGQSQRDEVRQTVCGVMAEIARERPERLDASFVEPLLGVLGAESEELRNAAARALAEFGGEAVPDRLGNIAADPGLAMTTRLAAVSALAPNTHRRGVVQQLITLLDLDIPEITDRVAATLAPIAWGDLGSNVEKWRSWWSQKSHLSEEQWLAEQLKVYRDRARRTTGEMEAHIARCERDEVSVTGRIREFQREVLRPLTPEQREAKLVEWIDDPLPVVKLASLSFIRSRIADEGKRPEGDVLAAVLRLLEHDSSPMRREALLIVGNVTDKIVVEAVLARLEREKDKVTRHAVLQALGKLGDPAAIPALVREIASEDSGPTCVREAASALGHVAGKVESSEALAPAAAPLKNRFLATSPGEPALRAALLAAMAGVADASFLPEFLSAVESDDAGILQPAIRGLLALNDSSKLPRIRTLMNQADPRVRLAAIETVSQLGREDADLEALLTRLNPAIEPNEAVRQAAWRGLRAFLARRSIPDRIRASERLRELPDLEVRYLEELANEMFTAGENTPNLETVRERLSTILIASGRDAEAIPHLRELYEMRLSRSDPRAFAVGLQWLEAVLRAPNQQGIADVITRVRKGTDDEAVRIEIVDIVSRRVDSPTVVADSDRARRLLAELRSVDTELLGDTWVQLLERFGARVESAGRTSPADLDD